ncbi:integral membrane sensor signal transduction histidine kinase [Actibacterium atlanticum]|uniref:histidine kinase n=1 Tax=Actibacterium atlanticum TaxID=1461693 RepID=A0A058ZJN2_9RHOB|nr:ATP-binding protein [Actibacterium atlanticum]KCV81809.1 integral membrane sensor signal transduction histidine kinase [Actibacterium atlanticum]
MKQGWIKRTLPRSLYGRAALILIVPIVTIQLVVSVQFIQRHFEGVTKQMSRNMAREVSFIVDQIDAAPSLPLALQDLTPALSALAIEVAPTDQATGPDRRSPIDLSGRFVISNLYAQLPQLVSVDLRGDTPWYEVAKQLRLHLKTRHGDVEVAFERVRVSASNPHQLLVLMIFASILMTVIAFIFLRNQLRPIRRLARAAEAFGKGQSVPYRISGANEVRAAGSAFLNMRGRIERQIEQRTMMLSGVSHDLRTPLTRMRLSLSLMEETPETEELNRDVKDMERMLDGFLDFARSETLDDPEPTDPAALLRGVADKAVRSGGVVTLGVLPDGVSVPLRAVAIERAVQNLVNNALNYGASCHLSLDVSDKMIRFSVEDDGPGIPADQREAAVKAFNRLDQSRNQNRAPGVGLGLAIASEIARSHGGVLRLGDSGDLGGLKAELVLAR